MVSLAISALVAFAAGAGITEMTRRVVLRRNILALPNERSSHEIPTPTAGGVAIVLPVTLACLIWLPDDQLRWSVVLAVVAVALVGLRDDIVEVRRSIRFAVHLLASAACAFGLGVAGPGAFLLTIAFAWALNLYNFMDGIDGIAASQALAFCLGALLLVPDESASVPILVVLAAACAAFLLFNWAPAQIFMGDVGSGFLGLTIAVVVAVLARADELGVVPSLVLLSVFWVDASYTLAVRILTRQRFTQGHRTHLYQIAAGRVGHARTVAMFWIYWIIWLMPWSWLAHRSEDWQYIGVTIAIGPLLIGCVVIGAGRARSTSG